jgi:hypothetical protein
MSIDDPNNANDSSSIPWQYKWKRPQMNPILYTSSSLHVSSSTTTNTNNTDNEIDHHDDDQNYCDDSTSSFLLSASSSFPQPTTTAPSTSSSSLLMKNGIVTCHVAASVSWNEIHNFVDDTTKKKRDSSHSTAYHKRDVEEVTDEKDATKPQQPQPESSETSITWHLSATLVQSCGNGNPYQRSDMQNISNETNVFGQYIELADVLILEIIESHPTTRESTTTTTKSLYASFQSTSSKTISPPKYRRELENFSSTTNLVLPSSSSQQHKEEQQLQEQGTYAQPDTLLSSTCLQSRILRWPGICTDDKLHTTSVNTGNNPLQSWWNGLTRRQSEQQNIDSNHAKNNQQNSLIKSTTKNFALSVGIVAVAWIRKPIVTNAHEATTKNSRNHTFDTADALDVIQLMSLFGAQSSTSVTKDGTDLQQQQKVSDETNHNENSNQPPPKSNSILELQLACLTSDGRVHIYSPWNLLKRHESTITVTNDTKSDVDNVDDMTGELASFFFGESLMKVVDDNMLPLSQPHHTIKLSVPFLQKPQSKSDHKKFVDSPLFPKPQKHRPNVSSIPEDSPSITFDETWKEEKKLNSIWDESVWNPIIDTETIHNQTRNNIPTHCVSAFDFIVIAGRGVQRWKRMTNLKLQQPRHRSPSLTAIDKVTKIKSSTDMIGDRRDLVERSTSDPSMSQQSLLHQQQHPVDSVRNDDPHHQEEYVSMQNLSDGGFLTFISTKHLSETRTIFLPFVPEHISPFHWSGASFLFVSGHTAQCINKHSNGYRNEQQTRAIAIRLDSSTIFTPQVYESATSVFGSTHPSLLSQSQISNGSTQYSSRQQNHVLTMIINRFEILPIDVPELVDDLQVSKIICSSASTVPPSLSVILNDNKTGNIAIGLHTMLTIEAKSREGVNSFLTQYEYNSSKSHILIINTHMSPGHIARGAILSTSTQNTLSDSKVWCHPGQGFCIAVTASNVSFICFEGSSPNRSPFVKLLYNTGQDRRYQGIVTTILAQNPFVYHQQLKSATIGSNNTYRDNFAVPSSAFAFDETNGISKPVEVDSESSMKTVINAMESISSITYRETVAGQSPASSPRRRSISFTHREKSIRLLQNSPWWINPSQSSPNTLKFNTQIPAMSIALHNGSHTLSIRKIMIDNGPFATFNQIISWLCEMEDYFSAACVALDILQDSETLVHLWMNCNETNIDEEKSKHEGLLDGIQPINRNSSTLQEISNMTITCLVKGGFPMSSTLEEFLSRNSQYDPASACLILVAIATGTLSDDHDLVMSSMGKYYSHNQAHSLNIMWPVRCLLCVGNSRGILPTALRLLNSAIPDELRQHQRSGMLSTSVPSIEICKQLVTLIVACNADAAGMLLDLVDEKNHLRFWQSLEHDARLELSLITINDQYPSLREIEIRNWAITVLGRSIEFSESLPTEWIRSVVWANFKNAGCDIATLCADLDLCDTTMTIEEVQRQIDIDGIRRNAMQSIPGSGGLDFDLLIPSLLILDNRCVLWHESSSTLTRTILNTACYLAGRRTSEEPLFPLDGATLMRLCTLLGDVEAGAKLIGGKNGLILECCHVLIESLDVSIDDAEELVLSSPMIITSMPPSNMENVPFILNSSTRRILYLLDEHVLRIRTYGEFDVQQLRGKVDPVFAARICFRTWWNITRPNTISATQWLVEWLRDHLLMDDKTKLSPHRLAAAAFLRALIWSESQSDTSEMMLATLMKMNVQFIIELSRSCCGLVEALPPSVIEESLQLLSLENKQIERAY